jgi:DNA-binding MarR family transcriptional regulator
LFQERYCKCNHATPEKFERERMQQMSTKMQQQIKSLNGGAKVMELLSKGETSQSEIARILQVDKSIICRDIACLRQQAKSNIKKYIDERLPEEYEKCLVGLTAITREAWSTAQSTEDKREKIQALSLAKDYYSMKLELLTNATVVDDAIRFVSQNSKEKLKPSANDSKYDKEESNEPDYEDRDQVEEEQEEETGELGAAVTTNQIF